MPDLDERTAAIWTLRADRALDDARSARCLDLLAPEERERHRRLPGRAQQRLFLLAHMFLRRSLSQHSRVAPHAWRYEYGPHGRAEISRAHALPSLRFNLSYCRNYIACAITRRADIGIDIETTQPVDSMRKAASRYLSDYELASFAGLGDPVYASRYLTYWTLKEAYIKARGKGFTVDPRQISFDVEGDSTARVALDGALDGEPNAWQFVVRRPTPSHMLALAVERGAGEPLDIAVRHIELEQLSFAEAK